MLSQSVAAVYSDFFAPHDCLGIGTLGDTTTLGTEGG